jgi:hypothetical protein
MKRNYVLLGTFIVIAAAAMAAQSAGQKSFDLMKALNGNWEGKNSLGEAVLVSFRVTSGGSAIMSEIQSQVKGQTEDMISMIHMDGDRLLLTHYCAAGNQPRMQASTSPDGRTVSFRFLDATNLANPDAGHMDHVVFTSVDANHHTEEWHFIDHGKEMVEKFDLQKKG